MIVFNEAHLTFIIIIILWFEESIIATCIIINFNSTDAHDSYIWHSWLGPGMSFINFHSKLKRMLRYNIICITKRIICSKLPRSYNNRFMLARLLVKRQWVEKNQMHSSQLFFTKCEYYVILLRIVTCFLCYHTHMWLGCISISPQE